MRLRRCLVTEVVTETETGQRHELQVEPIDDTDVADRTTPFGQSGQPVAEAPAEPDGNDWFRREGDPPR